MPRGVDVVDVVGHHVDPAVADRLVQIVVEDQAHPLIPRVVARLEVHVDVVALGQIAFRGARISRLLTFGALRASRYIRPNEQCVAPTG